MFTQNEIQMEFVRMVQEFKAGKTFEKRNHEHKSA
jgi:hypothetical protein